MEVYSPFARSTGYRVCGLLPCWVVWPTGRGRFGGGCLLQLLLGGRLMLHPALPLKLVAQLRGPKGPQVKTTLNPHSTKCGLFSLRCSQLLELRSS